MQDSDPTSPPAGPNSRDKRRRGSCEATQEAFESYLRAAEACCDECRAMARRLRARRKKPRRPGTHPPDVEALNLVVAGQALLSLPLADRGALVDAICRLAWVLTREHGSDEEALGYLMSFERRLHGQGRMSEVLDAWYWVTALVQSRLGQVRAARERLCCVFDRFSKSGQAERALAVAADRGRNFLKRFPAKKVEEMLDACVTELELDDDLRVLVEDAALESASGDRFAALRALERLRDALDVPVPDLLAGRRPRSTAA